jgi:L-alanine-DL-glutamate epimerase-like enolase superfamily enzyme
MKIVGWKLQEVRTPLEKVFRTSVRETREIREIHVVVEGEGGLTGQGAACALPKVTGEILSGMREAVEDWILPAIRGLDLDDFGCVLDRIQKAMLCNPGAKAAVDMAVHDLRARSLGVDVSRLLGRCRDTVWTDMTLSLDAPDRMAEEAKAAVGKGFSILKIKVGGDPEEDLRRVAEIRGAVGPDVSLRLDANQAWSPKEAVALIRRIERYQPELVEQPVPAEDFEGLGWVRARVDTPIMADESLRSPEDALRLISCGAVDMFNIKLLKCGGLHPARRIAALASAAGIECMMGCMMEGPVSLAAAVHFAVSEKSVTRADLDSLFFAAESHRALPGIDYGPRIRLAEAK